MSLLDFLKAQLRARDWSMTDLARAAGVSKQAVSQWMSEDEFSRLTPSPKSCLKLALALDADPDRLLQLAGHRPESEADHDESPISIEVARRQRQWQKMVDEIKGIPNEFVEAILTSVFDRTTDDIRDKLGVLIRLRDLQSQSTPVPPAGGNNSSQNPINKRPRQRLSGTSARGNKGITPPSHKLPLAS